MELKIIDTGYLNSDMEGTQLSASLRAGYDGNSLVNAIPLHRVTTQTIGGKANTDDTAQSGTVVLTEVSLNSCDNEIISLNNVIQLRNLPDGTWDVNFIHQLNRLKRTNGIKLLYADGEGTYDTALMFLGEVNKNGAMSPTFVPVDKPYLPVKVLDVKFTDLNNVNRQITVTITMQLTK